MSVSTTAAAPSRAVHFTLWGVQALLAAAFLMAGLMKSTQPIDALAAQMAWVTRVPAALVRFIGVSELLGALGLVLPSALRIAPRLTPLAGAGLALVMVLAAGHHLSNGDGAGPAVINAVLGGLALFVTWGRLTLAPISPRG